MGNLTRSVHTRGRERGRAALNPDFSANGEVDRRCGTHLRVGKGPNLGVRALGSPSRRLERARRAKPAEAGLVASTF